MRRRIIAKWVAAALTACFLLMVPQAALALGGDVGTPIGICIKRVLPGSNAAGILNRPTGFDCSSSQRSFGSGDFWIISQPIRTAAHVPGRLRTVSLWQRRTTLYAQYADGRTVMFGGDGRATSRRMQLGVVVEYRLPDRDVPVVRLLWKIEGAANIRGILISPRLATVEESVASNFALAAIYAGLAGLCFALLLYNAALYGALRHRFQLAYCVMVAMLMLYGLCSSGAFAMLFPDLPNTTRIRFSYVSLAACSSAALIFARLFFERRVFAGWLRHATSGAVLAVLGSATLLAVMAPWHIRTLDWIYALSSLALLMTAGPILWRAWRLKSRYLWVFATAWATPLSMAAVRIGNSFGLIHYSMVLDSSTLAALVIEAMTTSLAIASRVRMLSNERDQARELESAARLLADTDPLTGLLNRRAFLQQAIGRSGPQTLLILDLDHFKQVNETIGHDGGDEVLRVVARALRQSVPARGLVARLGGEEFACLFAAAEGPRPAEILDRLRVERMPFDISVTASIGTCTGPLRREVDWKALYRHADEALFAAKDAGRDRARDAKPLAA